MSSIPKIAGTKFKSGQRWNVEPRLIEHGTPFQERDHQYQFRVMDKQTGKTVAVFHREEIRTSCGLVYTGVKSVEISDDDSAVLTEFVDGRKEMHPLPV